MNRCDVLHVYSADDKYNIWWFHTRNSKYILSVVETYFECERVTCTYLNPTLLPWKCVCYKGAKVRHATLKKELDQLENRSQLKDVCSGAKKWQLMFQAIQFLIWCELQFSEVLLENLKCA